MPGIGVPSRAHQRPPEKPVGATFTPEQLLDLDITRAELAGDQALATRLRRLQQTRSDMSQDTYTAASTAVRTNLVAASAALSAFKADAADGKYPADYVVTETARLSRAVQVADRAATSAAADAVAAGAASAARLRAQAEAEVPATERLATLTERKMLADSKSSGDDLAGQARQMLAAGQPARAAMLLDAARDKGARVAPDLASAIDDALDASNPTRKAARAAEDELATFTTAFTRDRVTALRESGLGVRQDGSAGAGARGEVASASVASKLLAYQAGVREFPVGDGSNTPEGGAE